MALLPRRHRDLHSLTFSVLILLLLITSFLASCAKTDDGGTSPTDCGIEGPTGSVDNCTSITPEDGGTVQLPAILGGGTLVIPPGAVSTTTTVTVSSWNKSTPGRVHLGFEPDGLQLSAPARLTVPFQRAEDGSVPLIEFWLHSDMNPILDRTTEQVRWAPFENVVIDEANNMISGDMNHFSTAFVGYGTQRTAYMIIDIPGKYLRPGDLLFVLSGDEAYTNYNWVPGHVGLIRSVDPDTGETKVIESTLNGGPAGNVDGVQVNSFLSFKRGTHLYMGARRTQGPWFTDAQRRKAVEFAVSQLGQGYAIWSAPMTGGSAIGGWSCSALAERCMDEAGQGAIGDFAFFPSPVEMYEGTQDIHQFTVKVGEELRLPVYPVVVNPASGHGKYGGSGFYDPGPNLGATITVEGLPDGATFTRDNLHIYKAQTMVWTPKPSDAGTVVILNFRMRGSRTLDSGRTWNYSKWKPINIFVRGAFTTINVHPAGRGVSGLWYSKYLPVPEGAIIGESSQSHLVDSATGLWPTNPVFTDQYLDSFSENWRDDRFILYGVRFHIDKRAPAYSDPPPGTHVWNYSIDYREDLYSGLN